MYLDDETINQAILTDRGRRWVAEHLAAASRLTAAQMYRRLCEAPPDDAECIPDDAPTLVETAGSVNYWAKPERRLQKLPKWS